MRILQVNVVYGKGSTGKIVQTLHEEYLKLGQDSHVFYGRGHKSPDKRVLRTGFLWEAKLWRFIQLFTGNFLGGSPLSTWNLKRHIKKLHPDIVHLHCINGNMCNVYSLLKWLKTRGYRTVLTHHAKFMFTGGCGLNMCEGYLDGCRNCPLKQEVFGKYCKDQASKNIRRLSRCALGEPWIMHTYVSSWLKSQAEKSPLLLEGDNHVVFNPIDTKVFNSALETKPLHDKPYVFFPTSLHSENKGWQWVNAIGVWLKESEGLDLIVTGSGHEVFESPNVYDVGHVQSQLLMADYYRQARFTLVLSQCESFSMPVAESLCCGTPVCGFKAGGPESIAPDDYHSADYGELEQLFRKMHDLGKAKPKGLAEKSASVFSVTRIAQEFLKIYSR